MFLCSCLMYSMVNISKNIANNSSDSFRVPSSCHVRSKLLMDETWVDFFSFRDKTVTRCGSRIQIQIIYCIPTRKSEWWFGDIGWLVMNDDKKCFRVGHNQPEFGTLLHLLTYDFFSPSSHNIGVLGGWRGSGVSPTVWVACGRRPRAGLLFRRGHGL